LSRAFGDHFYKQESKLPLSSQQIIALVYLFNNFLYIFILKNYIKYPQKI